MGFVFIPSRCAKIDTVGSNVLIRGNIPLIAPDMRYALEEIQAASGVTDLLSRTFVEVPIIDNVGERPQWEAIFKAFNVDPNLFPESFWPPYLQPSWNPNAMLGNSLKTEGHSIQGNILWRPFEGLPENVDPNLFLFWPGWDFSGFVATIIELMNTMENTAIYVHCQLGADRTGTFHIGYLMRKMGCGLEEAIRIASSCTSAKAPNADYLRLATAYANLLGKGDRA